MTAGAMFFSRADASAGFWWPPGIPRAPKFALLNGSFVGFWSQRLPCGRAMLVRCRCWEVPLVGKPLGKASQPRKNHVRLHGDPKSLTSTTHPGNNPVSALSACHREWWHHSKNHGQIKQETGSMLSLADQVQSQK